MLCSEIQVGKMMFSSGLVQKDSEKSHSQCNMYNVCALNHFIIILALFSSFLSFLKVNYLCCCHLHVSLWMEFWSPQNSVMECFFRVNETVLSLTSWSQDYWKSKLLLLLLLLVCHYWLNLLNSKNHFSADMIILLFLKWI